MITLRHHLKYNSLICLNILLAGCGTESAPSQKAVESEVSVTSASPVVAPEAREEASQASEPDRAEMPEPVASESNVPVDSPPKKTVQEPDRTVYRPSDQRPVHNNQRLALLGIHCYESPRLKLYTDIDPERAKKLPAVIEQAYPALEHYFGPLPPDREGTEFQVTGYIMQNRELFQKAGVILESLPEIVNGRHQGAQFWMDAQTQEYYLRHLMLHEYTHSYSMIMGEIGAPVWYLEGIAESMATHQVDAEGKLQFNVMPYNKNDFGGLGRISLIQDAVLNAPPKTMLEIMQFQPDSFVNNNAAYAWSWALCQFFDKHPRYQSAFRELAHHMQGTAFSEKLQQMLGPDLIGVHDEWLLFARNLQPGYDSECALLTFQPGVDLSIDESKTTAITSDRGWQSSGVRATRGDTFEVSATGMFTLADQPKPWKSTAEGITFQYFQGQPLGRLLMMIRPDPGNDPTRMRSLLREYPQGAAASWMAPATGTIYFRLNDAWDSLNNNTGSVKVTVTRKGKPAGGSAEK